MCQKLSMKYQKKKKPITVLMTIELYYIYTCISFHLFLCLQTMQK